MLCTQYDSMHQRVSVHMVTVPADKRTTCRQQLEAISLKQAIALPHKQLEQKMHCSTVFILVFVALQAA